MGFMSRFTIPTAAALLSVAGAANAVVVLGVYDTGLGVGGTPLAAGDGQVDANYFVLSSDAPGVVAGSNALTYYNTAYFEDGPLSRIVNATGTGEGTAGTTTTFRTTFSLAGFTVAGATLTGQALFDNSGTVFLNGVQLGGAITGFTSLTPFTASSGFVSGVNTLDFVLVNDGGPEAFQVAGLTVTAEPLAVIPEPATWALMIAGFSMVGFSLRRRTRTRVLTA